MCVYGRKAEGVHTGGGGHTRGGPYKGGPHKGGGGGSIQGGSTQGGGEDLARDTTAISFSSAESGMQDYPQTKS